MCWDENRRALSPAEKVLKRLDYEIKKADIEAIVNCRPGVIEGVLMQVQQKVWLARVWNGFISVPRLPPTGSPCPAD